MSATRYSGVLHGSTNGQLKKAEKSIMKLRGLSLTGLAVKLKLSRSTGIFKERIEGLGIEFCISDMEGVSRTPSLRQKTV